MLTPSQAKRIEAFARHVTVAEHPVAPPALARQLLDLIAQEDDDQERRIRHEWAYALFIEIGRGPDDAQGHGMTVMVSERSPEALAEAIAIFWQSLAAEGAFNA